MAILALDAMGVIFQAADDVADLLIPFISQNGGIKDINRIKELYTLTSLGKMSAASFWESVSVDPSLEDSYLSGHVLSDGFPEFIIQATHHFDALYCISNDVSEWSIKLRKIFCLENLFAGFIVSGDIGSRKPSKEIFQYFLDAVKANPFDVTFVDDRAINLDTAEKMGFNPILFGAEYMDTAYAQTKARDYTALSIILFKN